MEMPYFGWMRQHGWTHFDTHFVYCNKDHSTPGGGRGKKRIKSGNYYRTEESGAVVVRALLNVQTHVFACRDCVWNMYQQERKHGRITEYEPPAEPDNEPDAGPELD